MGPTPPRKTSQRAGVSQTFDPPRSPQRPSRPTRARARSGRISTPAAARPPSPARWATPRAPTPASIPRSSGSWSTPLAAVRRISAGVGRPGRGRCKDEEPILLLAPSRSTRSSLLPGSAGTAARRLWCARAPPSASRVGRAGARRWRVASLRRSRRVRAVVASRIGCREAAARSVSGVHWPCGGRWRRGSAADVGIGTTPYRVIAAAPVRCAIDDTSVLTVAGWRRSIAAGSPHVWARIEGGDRRGHEGNAPGTLYVSLTSARRNPHMNTINRGTDRS
jgi:hypothetical protein